MRSSQTMTRDTALDLLKWLAVLSMVLDHLRYVGWSLNILYVPGRLAFPWFCLAIAANLARKGSGQGVQWRYLGSMVVFACVAELPYRLYISADATTLSVMPTLAVGLLVARGWIDRTVSAWVLAGLALLLAWVFREQLMFGFYGALLPLSFLWALRRPWYAALLPGAVCLASNAWPQMFAGASWGDPISIGGIIVCLSAPLIGLAILRSHPPIAIWPMRRWAYAIYPVHFLLLLALRTAVGPL
ncbi:TraX family protein [Pseudomonas sp. 10B1]|uniref:TraX family protein n=1 Tax=unclassified Pseudomonas TaxID=196821 RepID=UPI002AB5788B|nr:MULTISPECIES: TraX family protein [unclassified Pseudomonas]MDY7562259.1 TraX family protein [Pseudomonas sp. AB6]MEA9976271.1 TraX family protein [Pseudomonas sp. RTS4]MEA9994818.1 TraX family protein [Pseudomonas sp. AA4]MEB0086481.1 TraX family protein [Pseudomonas sp. RTI1]MEB0126320.1 TraX family protein [Pseudomonas sp. CCC1.2]